MPTTLRLVVATKPRKLFLHVNDERAVTADEHHEEGPRVSHRVDRDRAPRDDVQQAERRRRRSKLEHRGLHRHGLRPHTALEDQIAVQALAIALQGHARIFLGLRENPGGLFVEQIRANAELPRLREEHVPIRRTIVSDARRGTGELNHLPKVRPASLVGVRLKLFPEELNRQLRVRLRAQYSQVLIRQPIDAGGNQRNQEPNNK